MRSFIVMSTQIRDKGDINEAGPIYIIVYIVSISARLY